MESKKFCYLLEDIESCKYNVGKIEIIKCYVAQRFTVGQVIRMINLLTHTTARLNAFKLLVEEMNVCQRLEEGVSLINAISGSASDVESRFSCLEELVNYKKLNLKESEKKSLSALFEGTKAQERTTRLLNITSHISTTYQADKLEVPASRTATLPTTPHQPPAPIHPTHHSTYLPYRPYYQPGNYLPPTTTIYANAHSVGVVPPKIGFLLPQDVCSPYPQPMAQPQTTNAEPAPGVGFTVKL